MKEGRNCLVPALFLVRLCYFCLVASRTAFPMERKYGELDLASVGLFL